MINISKESWNERDMIEMNTAKVRCEQKYPDAPCLTKFVKVEPLMYRAICGESEKGC
jgi:hypothetical protein